MSDQPQYPTYPDYQQQQYQQPQPYPPPQPPKKGGIGKWIALGGCGCLFFLAFIAGIVYFVFQMTAAPMKAVNDQLATIRAGNIEQAYNDCTAEFRKETSLDQFKMFLRGYPFFSTAKEFTSINRKTANGVVTLDGTVESSDGSKHPVEYRLTKESGQYRVHAIQVKEDATPVNTTEESQQGGGGYQQENQAPSGSSDLEIFDVNVDKSQSGQMITVTAAFQVRNFQNDQQGGTYAIHLVQDLETTGPDGNVMSDLSRQGIKTLSESGGTEYTSANFSNTLTIPESYPHGTYNLRLTVHDQIGGGSAEYVASFDFP